MDITALGTFLGCYQSDAFPFWMEWLVRLPLIGKRYAKKAVSEIGVYQHGISLKQYQGRHRLSQAQILPYKEIRRVWFERFNTGSETAGRISFRIDIIAENLDTLFKMTKVNCAADDAEMLLMESLFESWKAHNWKHHHVVAAIVSMTAAAAGRTDIANAQTPVYLCMQRPQTRYDYTSYHWEFPGGKVEPGETEPEALQRELQEEMSYDIHVVRHLTTVEHEYRDFAVTLSCYLCTADTAEFVRKEHNDHRWLTLDEMPQLEWCAADAPVLSLLATDAAASAR